MYNNVYNFLFNSVFSFLGKLTQYNTDTIVVFAKHLHNVYMEDLEDNFPNERIHLRAYLKNKDNMSILQLSKRLKEYGMYEIYPNIDIAICVFACKTNENVIAVTDMTKKIIQYGNSNN